MLVNNLLPPRLILEVRILKSFKSCVFGSADSERVMSVFFGSADCKGVSGEPTSKAAKAAGLRGLRPALHVEGVGPDNGMIFWLRMAFTRRRLRWWRRVGLRVWVGGNL
jgi:hypothetical protein